MKWIYILAEYERKCVEKSNLVIIKLRYSNLDMIKYINYNDNIL